MNKRKKALLLSAMCSLAVLSGCSKAKEVEIDGEAYYQVDDTYVKKETGTKIFEPGEHYIYIRVTHAYGEVIFDIPECPEGYTYSCATGIDEGRQGYTNAIMYYFINTKTVEAEGTFDPINNEIQYLTPGKVVDTLSLEKGN